MNLEQQYSRLVAQSTPPTAAQKGQKFIKDLLGLGKTYNEVVNFQNSPGGKQLSDALNKKKAA